jgi:hypothetical protein
LSSPRWILLELQNKHLWIKNNPNVGIIQCLKIERIKIELNAAWDRLNSPRPWLIKIEITKIALIERQSNRIIPRITLNEIKQALRRQ